MSIKRSRIPRRKQIWVPRQDSDTSSIQLPSNPSGDNQPLYLSSRWSLWNNRTKCRRNPRCPNRHLHLSGETLPNTINLFGPLSTTWKTNWWLQRTVELSQIINNRGYRGNTKDTNLANKGRTDNSNYKWWSVLHTHTWTQKRDILRWRHPSRRDSETSSRWPMPLWRELTNLTT